MRFFYAALVFCCSTALCYGQAAVDDATFLRQARAKYDVPFDRNLQSFSCGVVFDWKRHFTEVVRLGDEGTDQEIAKFIEPIHTRVTVTRQNATASAGMSDDEVKKLPRGGMAELLLEHAVQYSLNNWLGASGTQLLPPEDAPVHVVPFATGYTLTLKIQTFDVEMLFTRDMRLQSEAVKGAAPDSREMSFDPGPHGFVLSSFKQGEDGAYREGNRILLSYTYQTVGGFQIPEQVAINRESHHEMWHYKLTDCTVQTTK